MVNNYSHSGTVFNIYWGQKHYLLMEGFTLKGLQEKRSILINFNPVAGIV